MCITCLLLTADLYQGGKLTPLELASRSQFQAPSHTPSTYSPQVDSAALSKAVIAEIQPQLHPLDILHDVKKLMDEKHVGTLFQSLLFID